MARASRRWCSRPRTASRWTPTAPQPKNVVAPAPAKGPALADLESFLINFVVEQTGYPVEVVDLDADLEADLGIDSIKKAQLFGELQEYFDVGTTDSNLSLDDFPTLRHVLRSKDTLGQISNFYFVLISVMLTNTSCFPAPEAQKLQSWRARNFFCGLESKMK